MRKTVAFSVLGVLLGVVAVAHAESDAELVLRYFDNSPVVKDALNSKSADLRREVLLTRQTLARIRSIGLTAGNRSLTPIAGSELFECTGKIGASRCRVFISDSLVSLERAPNSWLERGWSLASGKTTFGGKWVQEIWVSSHAGRNLSTGEAWNHRVRARAIFPSNAGPARKK
ncbi:MAG: hypothetical protein H6707_11620 [Deltaproteobacteria bacterium]|nr:hypothetical protein [Deltaproteobacteria bacterium]